MKGQQALGTLRLYLSWIRATTLGGAFGWLTAFWVGALTIGYIGADQGMTPAKDIVVSISYIGIWALGSAIVGYFQTGVLTNLHMEAHPGQWALATGVGAALGAALGELLFGGLSKQSTGAQWAFLLG